MHMLVGMMYFIVVILANTIGAVSGMGGGVIIRPIFDSLGFHSVAAISFYSSVAVFTMSISSTYRQISSGMRIQMKPALTISLGSILGGFFGNTFFEYLLNLFSNDDSVQLIQAVLTILSLLFVLTCTKEGMKTCHFINMVLYFLVGLFLGFFASLLGIGGGPINVTLLMLMFSIPIKEATIYSIITIFFSQLSRLVSVGFTTGFGVFDLSILFWVVPAAILGGFFGSKLSYISPDEMVLRIFKVVVISVIILNAVNGIKLVLL